MKNKFSVGDSLELMTPQGNVNFTLEHMENGKGERMPVAPGDDAHSMVACSGRYGAAVCAADA